MGGVTASEESTTVELANGGVSEAVTSLNVRTGTSTMEKIELTHV